MKNQPLNQEQIANLELHILYMLPTIGLEGHQVWAEEVNGGPDTGFEFQPVGVNVELKFHEDSRIYIGNTFYNEENEEQYQVEVTLDGEVVYVMQYKNMVNALSAFWAQLAEFTN